MKSIIKPDQLNRIVQKLTIFFNLVEDLALQTQFVQRKSRLTGLRFVQALIIGFLKYPHASLNQLAQECAHLQVAISPQGLHARINAHSQAFLKALYEKAYEHFQHQCELPIGIVRQFGQILFVDSTFRKLPDCMQEAYPGPGGTADLASLKTQLVFDFVRGNLMELTLQAARTADQAYTQYLDLLQAGGLVIMDLGYFNLKALACVDKKAYFLMRYHYPTALYDLAGQRLDLFTLLEAQTWRDVPILLGASPENQIACRLISAPLPLAAAEERRRKARRKAAQHKKTLSEAYLRSLGWSIYLTNVPGEQLEAQAVVAFYRLRWQIELIFKFWKSYCGLNHPVEVRPERVMTEFYAKLLVAVLCYSLFAPVRLPDEAHPEREMSAFQVRKILTNHARKLIKRVLKPTALEKVLTQFYQQVARYGYKQIRRKKPNALLGLTLLPFDQPS